MLTRKILFEAFLIFLFFFGLDLAISYVLARTNNYEWMNFSYFLVRAIMIFLVIVAVYKESDNPYSSAFVLAIITDLLVGRGFVWPDADNRNNFSFIALATVLVIPVVVLISSFIFFRARKLDAAKAFAFYLLCYFVAAAILYFVISLPENDHSGLFQG